MKHKKNNRLLKWFALIIGILCLTITLFTAIPVLAFSEDPALSNGWLSHLFFFILAIFLAIFCCRITLFLLAKYLNQSGFKRFTPTTSLDTFQETRPKYHNPNPKLPHAVLLLHGFTVSAQQFDSLTAKLETTKLPYFSPNNLGFGLNSTRLIQKTSYKDWFRDALEHFDQLQMVAENISIVGHSMGCILATFIAQQRKVKNLILSAPAYYTATNDMCYKKALSTPYLSRFYNWMIPFFPKSIRADRKTTCDTLDASNAIKTFQYQAMPVAAIAEFFKAQDTIDLTQAKFETLTFLHGKHDITVDNAKTLAYLRQNKFVFAEYIFENSAHNIFEDYDREKVCEVVLNILEVKK